MMCQIEAEEVKQEEIDFDGDQYVVAEAEQLYRDATVEVKQLSMKLVLADKAFSLVRSRMEKLVETIESLLVHIEDGDAPDEGSSSDNDTEVDKPVDRDQEREKLVARAKRAEMSAEIAAKQEAEKIKSEKQREIDDLKVRLDLASAFATSIYDTYNASLISRISELKWRLNLSTWLVGTPHSWRDPLTWTKLTQRLFWKAVLIETWKTQGRQLEIEQSLNFVKGEQQTVRRSQRINLEQQPTAEKKCTKVLTSIQGH